MNMREACFKFYSKAEKVIVPSLKYSQAIYEELLVKHSNKVSMWLDLGCGQHLLPPWRLEQERSLAARPKVLVGLDYDFYSLKNHKTIKNRIRGDISNLPFPTGMFDLVTSNMVMEHLSDPETQLREVFRVLRPGGRFIFHTPNSISYGTGLARMVPESIKARTIYFLQRRKEEDVFPTYYKINTERTIVRCAHGAGFEVDALRFIVSSAQLIMVPPLVIIELLLIRILMTSVARPLRTNIVAILRKPSME